MGELFLKNKLSQCLIFRFWHLFANCVSRCASNLSEAAHFLLSPFQILRMKLFCPLESPCIELHFTEIGLCAIKAQPRTAGGGWHFDWDILPLITCKFQRGDMNRARQTLFFLSLPFALSSRSVTRRVMLSITLWHLYAVSDCGGVLIKAHHFLSCGLVSARNQTSQTYMETTLSVISSNKHTLYIHMFPLCIWMHCCLRGIS